MFTEIIEDYQKLQKSIDKLVNKSGYSIDLVCEHLRMDVSTYQEKLISSSFTITELKSLIEFIDVDNLEDAVLNREAEEGKKSGYLSEEEKNKLFDEYRNNEKSL